MIFREFWNSGQYWRFYSISFSLYFQGMSNTNTERTVPAAAQTSEIVLVKEKKESGGWYENLCRGFIKI